MLKKEEEHTEVGSFYFTHFLSDTDLAKRVYTFCLPEIFTDYFSQSYGDFPYLPSIKY